MGLFQTLETPTIREDRALVVHAYGKRFSAIQEGRVVFFEKLAQYAQREGLPCYLVDQSELASGILQESDHINIIFGPSHADGPNLFHADESYIVGFWYLDPKGVFWNSSLADAEFDPSTIDAKEATYFFNGVTGFMLRENYSKRTQTLRLNAPLDKAKAVIFAQDIENYMTKVHYLTLDQMIETAAQATDETVYVKPHPLYDAHARDALAARCAEFKNVVLSDASVHDLIAASDVVLSQNSAAGFEAFMQKKPVITCGASDYHHGSLVARSSDALKDAIAAAPDIVKSFPYEKYFYWFLHDHMLEVQKPDFAKRAWARLSKRG
ncbi:MAG: hypothetical protein AAF429_10695 [Pseudomonadota bacterium]